MSHKNMIFINEFKTVQKVISLMDSFIKFIYILINEYNCVFVYYATNK